MIIYVEPIQLCTYQPISQIILINIFGTICDINKQKVNHFTFYSTHELFYSKGSVLFSIQSDVIYFINFKLLQ